MRESMKIPTMKKRHSEFFERKDHCFLRFNFTKFNKDKKWQILEISTKYFFL